MSLLYADTSALTRAYFDDEAEHEALRERLLEGGDTVVTSELARVEFASAARSAAASGRHPDPLGLVARFDADCQEGGPIGLVRFHSEKAIPLAHGLVLQHRLRVLDALHLAVALDECPPLAGADDIVFVTRNGNQSAAAVASGLTVA